MLDDYSIVTWVRQFLCVPRSSFSHTFFLDTGMGQHAAQKPRWFARKTVPTNWATNILETSMTEDTKLDVIAEHFLAPKARHFRWSQLQNDAPPLTAPSKDAV